MNSTITLSGVCNGIVYKWLLMAIYHEELRIKHLKETEDGLVVQFSDDAYDLFRRIYDQIQEAEADIKIEIESY